MSTRSVIAKTNEDLTVEAIYCHFDGYVHGGVGEKLHKYYRDNKKIEELIALGPISILGKDVAPAEGVQHSFDNPAGGVTVAYHRDRGEEYNPASVYENAQFLLEKARDLYWAEYVYVWKNGEWWVGSPFEPKNGFAKVENVLNN